MGVEADDPVTSLKLSSVGMLSGLGTSVPSGTTAKVKAERSASSLMSPKPLVNTSGAAFGSSAFHL